MAGIKKILAFRLIDILPFRDQPTKIAMRNWGFIGFIFIVLIGLFYLITNKEKGVEAFLFYLAGGILFLPAMYLIGVIINKLEHSTIKKKWLFVGLCCGLAGFIIAFFIGLIAVAILSYNSGLITKNFTGLIYGPLLTFCMLFIIGILLSPFVPRK